MANINFSPTVFPKKEIVAKCAECGKEIERREWEYYTQYNRLVKKILATATKCPHCGAVFRENEKKAVIPWQKTTDGDYIAKAQNGDFLVWKYGFGYRWRYRRYGVKEPERINYARTKAEAQKACQRHAEWK